MKTALTLAFAVILLSTAAYASAQSSSGAAQPPASTNTAPPSMTPGNGMMTPGNGMMAPGTGMMNGRGRHHGPCREDVDKLCANVQKGGGRILACLKEHEGQLSPRCEAAMKRHAERDAVKGKAAPVSSTPPAAAPAPANNNTPPAK